MKSLLMVLSVSVIYSASTEAQVKDLGKISVLAEQTHQAVEAAAPVGEDFKLDSKSADRLQAYANYQDDIAKIVDDLKTGSKTKEEDCDPSKEEKAAKEEVANEIMDEVKKRKYTVGLYASYNTDGPLIEVTSHNGLASYQNFMRKNNQHYSSDYNRLVHIFLKYRPNVKKDWDNYSHAKRAELMTKYVKDKFGLEIPNSLVMREEIISATLEKPGDWNKNISILKDTLTQNEKLEFLADLGNRFLLKYNYDRVNTSGAVPVEDMFSSLATDTPGGICRDVVAAQSEIAMALGIDQKNIYRIGYQTATGSHQTLAIVDPDDPSNLYKINYGEVMNDDQNKGEVQLKQNGSSPVTGIAYRVYDAKGKPVLEMPTELGKLLREASGYENKGDISKTYNINKVYVDTEYGTGALVSGSLSDGTKVTAVSFDGEFSGVDYGMALYKTDGQNHRVETQTQGLYAYMNMTGQYAYKASDRVTVQADFTSSLELQASKGKMTHIDSGDVEESETMFEPRIGVTPGVEVRYSGDKLDAYARAEIDGYVHFKDAHDQSSKSFNKNGVTYRSGLGYKFSDTLKASLNAAVHTRTVGDFYIVQAALEDKARDYVVAARHQAPIGNAVASFIPGSYSVTEVEGYKGFKREDGTGPAVSITYSEDELAGGRVNLGGSWSFY